jgi:ribonuclease inhibitor
MRKILLDFSVPDTKEKAHDYIAEQMGFPDYYGKNLDALYDMLTEPRFGEGCVIRFTGCEELKESMPRYLMAMKQMCSAAAETNPGLTVLFTD